MTRRRKSNGHASDPAFLAWCNARGFNPNIVGGDPAVLYRVYLASVAAR